MSDSTTTTSESMVEYLTGRLDIFSAASGITRANVIQEANDAIAYHLRNVIAEEYLYWYRRGYQPVLSRTKERNDFVLNKVVENHAEEFCVFKNGYFLMEPAFYVSRNNKTKGKVDKLNEYLYRSGKQAADNKVADWFHMTGKGVLFVEPADDDEIPVRAYALDPRSAFVVYSIRPGNKPLFACNMVASGNEVYIDLFTSDTVYRLYGRDTSEKTTAYPNYEALALELRGTEPNVLGHIPIIEYKYNSVGMSCFEPAISLLDAINETQSNRIDGVSQFIQSLAIAVNCEFEDGVTANTIREAGMIALRSVGENKADFKILSEELNQDQTETLVDNLYDQALRICAMPTVSQRGTSTSLTGQAAIFNDGWEQAASSARDTEDLFRESNRYFDEILIDVLKRRNLLDIKITDFELNFVRNETANVQSKAQAFQTMISAGLHPELALTKSGLSNDPVSDYKMSEKYIKLIWGDPDAPPEEQAKWKGTYANVDGPAVKGQEQNVPGQNPIQNGDDPQAKAREAAQNTPKAGED